MLHGGSIAIEMALTVANHIDGYTANMAALNQNKSLENQVTVLRSANTYPSKD